MKSLIRYQHIKTEGERFDNREGGLVACKVSDHDNALNCSHCGRPIVRICWILDTNDNKAKPYGLNCVHLILNCKPLCKGEVIAMSYNSFKDIERDLIDNGCKFSESEQLTRSKIRELTV
jgi:hypothetical protein